MIPPGLQPGPPFEPGNTVALKHGAYSPRRVDPLATEILDAVLPTVTWWQPADMPAVWAWAQTEARIQLIREWLAEQGGDLHDTPEELGAVRSAAAFVVKLETMAARARADLGLTPSARARLGRDTAAGQVDVAKLMAVLSAQEDGDDG